MGGTGRGGGGGGHLWWIAACVDYQFRCFGNTLPTIQGAWGAVHCTALCDVIYIRGKCDCVPELSAGRCIHSNPSNVYDKYRGGYPLESVEYIGCVIFIGHFDILIGHFPLWIELYSSLWIECIELHSICRICMTYIQEDIYSNLSNL